MHGKIVTSMNLVTRQDCHLSMQAAGCEVLTSLESMSWDLWNEDMDVMERFLDGQKDLKRGPLFIIVL